MQKKKEELLRVPGNASNLHILQYSTLTSFQRIIAPMKVEKVITVMSSYGTQISLIFFYF